MTPEALRALPVRSGEPLPERAEIAIVGGGVMGLAIAYNLARRGVTDVVVIERGYLAEGASGRNGGGVRQQWATEGNIRLMQQSVDICRRFARELGVNVWFRQGGYLFLARSADQVARLEKTVAIQERCGLPTRMLSPGGAQDIVPELDTRGIVGACYNPSDGILFPWPFLWGYAQRATELGARVHTHTAVTRIDVDKGGGFVVHSDRGAVRARRVVNACGAWSPEVARLVGIELPTRPIRHEICSSEPLKPFLRPMVSELGTGLYCSQSMRGEIVGGVTVPSERPGTVRLGSTLAFLRTYAAALTRLLPVLGDIKVLRQWAGPYDLSPDGNPILGDSDAVPGFYFACGFVGHGFMMAPVVGQLYADYLCGEPAHEIFERYRLARFHGENALEVEDFNIG